MAKGENGQKKSKSQSLKAEYKYQHATTVLLALLGGWYELLKNVDNSYAKYFIIPAAVFALAGLVIVAYYVLNHQITSSIQLKKYSLPFVTFQIVCLLCIGCSSILSPVANPPKQDHAGYAPGDTNHIVQPALTYSEHIHTKSVATNDIIMNFFEPSAIAGFAGSLCLLLGGIFIHLGCAQYIRAIGEENESEPVVLGNGGQGFWAEIRMLLQQMRAKLHPVYELRRIWDVYVIFGCLSVTLGLICISDVVFIDQIDGFACLRPLQCQFAFMFVGVFLNNLLCYRFTGQKVSKRFIALSLLVLLILIFINNSSSFFFVKPSDFHKHVFQGIIDPVQAGPMFIVFPIMMLISLCFILWGKWKRSTALINANSRIAAIVKENESRFYPFYLSWNVIFNLTGLFIYTNIVFFPNCTPPVPPHCFAILIFVINSCFVFFGGALARLSSHQNTDSLP